MAALTIVAGTLLSVGSAGRSFAGDANAKEKPKASGSVDLHLVISGLKSDRTEVVIAPGTGGTTFETRTLKVSSNPVGAEVGQVELWVRRLDVATSGADRECSVSITLKEPGQTDRYTRRGFRLSTTAATKAQRVDYYLTASGLAARPADDSRKSR